MPLFCDPEGKPLTDVGNLKDYSLLNDFVSRVDKRISFNLADDFQIRKMFINFFGQRQVSQPTDETSTATYGSIASFLGMKRKLTSINDDSSHKMPKFTTNDLDFYSRCFANYIRPFTVAPAEIQAFFLNCRDDDIEVVAHKGKEFLEFIKSLRPQLSKSTSQPQAVDQLVVVASQSTPLQSNVNGAITTSIPSATPTLSAYEQKPIEEDITSPSSEEYEQDELSQEDTDSDRHESEAEEAEEESFSMSDETDKIQDEEELTTEDEETVEEDDEEQALHQTTSNVQTRNDDNDDLEHDVEAEYGNESYSEIESNVKITTDIEVHKEVLQERVPNLEDEPRATSVPVSEVEDEAKAETEQQSLATNVPSASDSETAPHPEYIGVAKELSNETKKVAVDDNQVLTDKQAESDGNKYYSEQSELDLTPIGKQVESMPFPSPKKQEKVVADVLKHKMSRGLSFMEATDLIFKEGIQGVDAAVINRVLGEKSVTPIKRTVNRKPSFQAKRASYKLSRRLKRERSKQKMMSDENEWRDEKSDATLKREDESSGLVAAINQDLTGKARKKVHYEYESPLRKFAGSQKHASLHKAANLSTRSKRKSLTKSPKRTTTNTDPEGSSEYDSGTERARKELDDFLQRKATTSNKGVKAEKS